jgi:ribosomal protein S12 methylthiotransferase
MNVQESISFQLNRGKVDKRIKAIIDKTSGPYYIGRSEMDSPEVDNEILINQNSGRAEQGQFCEVKITGAENFDLYAELV